MSEENKEEKPAGPAVEEREERKAADSEETKPPVGEGAENRAEVAEESPLKAAAAKIGAEPPAEPKQESAAQARADRAKEVQTADPSVQTTSEPSDSPSSELQGPSDAEKEAKAKAAAEARARAAAARAKKAEAESAEPKAPSPKQPLLDRLVQLIKEHVAEDAVEEASINELNGHLPTVVVKNERWRACAELLKNHEELQLNYLRNVSGVDQETHMEVVYHLQSLKTGDNYCVKVKTDRERPSIASVTPIWATANWNEREIYDLLGIDFPGHPDLRRIMMPDDWVGHPLRKDYVPIDPEV